MSHVKITVMHVPYTDSKQFKARTIISMTLVKNFYGEDMIVPPTLINKENIPPEQRIKSVQFGFETVGLVEKGMKILL